MSRMDFDRALDSWMAEGPDQIPDHTVARIFTTFEMNETRKLRWLPRRETMNRVVFALGGAAAVLVVAVMALGLYVNQPGGVGGQPSPTTAPRSSPSAEPSRTAEPSSTPKPSITADAGIPVGEFLLYDGRYGDGVPITVNIPASGWHGEEGVGILVKNDNPDAPDGAGMIGPFVGDDVYVYGDPCQWSTTLPDAPSTTVDEIVAALQSQASRDASEPVDITVDGYAGKSITLHVPDDAVFAECYRGEFRTLVDNPAADGARYHQDPGQIDELWILDVDGVLTVFDAGYYEGTPAEHVAEVRAIAESATFETP
jgi:hypothetical protein